MPLIPANDPRPASYAKDKAAIWNEIRALWRLNHKSNQTVVVSGSQSSQTQFAYEYVVVQ